MIYRDCLYPLNDSAAGGFSFGGGASAPAASSDGGDKKFSFGGSTSAATDNKGSSGFSFGGGDTNSKGNDKPAPSFYFGGGANATTTTDASKDSKASSSGGFSFGGGATAEKDGAKDTSSTTTTNTTTPAAKSGFSFGTPATSATPGPTPAAKVPSPVVTPATGLNTPAANTPAASTSTPATTAAATDNKPQMIEPPPIEYQTLTIEQILNRFQSELETDTISFLQEAQRISQYDATLRDTQHSLSELANMVSRLMFHQNEVGTQLQGIGSYQNELGKTLDQLEKNVDELFAAQSKVSVESADIEREKAYERALEIDSKLGQMGNVLENVVSDLNAAQERVWSSSSGNGEGKDEEVGKIIGVFNAHHETLAYLENRARAVESDLVVVGQVLAKHGQ